MDKSTNKYEKKTQLLPGPGEIAFRQARLRVYFNPLSTLFLNNFNYRQIILNKHEIKSFMILNDSIT